MSDTAPKIATCSATVREPTKKEAFFFLTILNSMKNKPEVDWDLVATRASYSNGMCAKTRFCQIKRAIGYHADAPISATGSPSSGTAVGCGKNNSPSKIQKKHTNSRKPRVKKAETNAENSESKDELAQAVSNEHFKAERDEKKNWNGADACGIPNDLTMAR